MMLKKQFSTREKVLVLVLIVVILGVCFYKFFLTPMNEKIDSYNSMAASEQAEIDTNMVKVLQMKKMQNEIDELKASGAEPIPTYDNSSALMIELNSILSKALEYSLSFGTVTNDEYIKLRPIDMTFETETYADARAIIDKLYASKNLMQISNMSIVTSASDTSDVTITNLSITYFEVDQDYEPEAEETTATTEE